ncbi:MAG TPA: MmcQ/YjbR family DNA-binding protein [Anaeromyxobacter sp.]|nr:MmcQ/YjbR family DNA-binding protein [Anaeromyxobacter sp.]
MAARPPRLLDPDAQDALVRLRRLLAGCADVEETVTFSNPTFKAGGKAFAVLDHYRGAGCLWLRVELAERDRLLSQEGWFESPYDPRRSALCVRLDSVDWRRLPPLLEASRLTALGARPRPAGAGSPRAERPQTALVARRARRAPRVAGR